MVVEGINVEDIFGFCILDSFLIGWIFGILAYEEDQNSYVYKILSQMFVYRTQTAWSRASELGNSCPSYSE